MDVAIEETTKNSTDTPVRTAKRYHSIVKLCSHSYPDGRLCKNIALKNYSLCHIHSNLPKVTRVEASINTNPRYKIPENYKNSVYNGALSSENIYSLKDEIALSQANLQSLLNNPKSTSQEFSVAVDTIRKTIETAKKIEQYAKQDDIVKVIIARINIVITKHCDKDTRLAIARDIYALRGTLPSEEDIEIGKGGVSNSISTLPTESLPGGVSNLEESPKNINKVDSTKEIIPSNIPSNIVNIPSVIPTSNTAQIPPTSQPTDRNPV